MSRSRIVGAAFVASALWFVPSIALACGAFVPPGDSFDGGEPGELIELVGHDREQMAYVVDNGRLTVYQGRSFIGNPHGSRLVGDDSSSEFAWLLPVPGKPEIEMAPADIFERLDEKTAPSFVLDDESDGACPAEVRTLEETVEDERGIPMGLEEPGAIDDGATLGAGEPEGAGVAVVDTGQVGPYEHTTITTRDDLDRPGERALEWLDEHGYALEAVDDVLLDDYLEDGANLLAFRLRTDADANEIQPVAISVDADQALSPIRLGAMGAAEQTGIQVWVAADHQVVPETYAQVKPNQALIDWSDDGSNYDDVVADAVEEAGGQAFAVDATKDTADIEEFLLSSETLQSWEEVRSMSAETTKERRAKFTKVAKLLDELEEDVSGDIFGHHAELDQELFPVRRQRRPFTYEIEWDGAELVKPDADTEEGSQELEKRVAQSFEDVPSEELLSCYLDYQESHRDTRRHERPFARLEVTVTIDQTEDESLGFESDSSALGEETESCAMDSIRSAIESHRGDLESMVREVNGGRLVVRDTMEIGSDLRVIGDLSTVHWVEITPNQDLREIDWEPLVKMIDDQIITPRKRAQERLTSVDTLTRLSTTMSPEDMTRDAYFVEEPKAEARPRKRRASRTVLCGGASEQTKEVTEAGKKWVYTTRDWRFEPPRGTVVEGHDEGWPDDTDDVDAAYDVVERRSDKGGVDPEEARREDDSRDHTQTAWARIAGIVVVLMLPVVGAAVVVRRRVG